MAAIKKYTEYFVDNFSFFEALKTFPLMENYSELSLLAGGLKYPRTRDERERYLDSCHRLNIAPFSSSEIKTLDSSSYKEPVDFIPHRLFLRGDFKPDILEKLINGGYELLNGKVFVVYEGQPNKIRKKILSRLKRRERFFPDAKLILGERMLTLRFEPGKLIGLTAKMMDWYLGIRKRHCSPDQKA